MFGYVNVYKPELKFNEYYEIRGFYCGLCKELKKKYGASGQMTLTYDMTFLITLLTALYESEVTTDDQTCIAHPLKKQLILRSEATEYGADMNVALTFLKFKDDYNDGEKIKGSAGMAAFKKAYKNVAAKYPRQCGVIEKKLSELDALQTKYKDDLSDPLTQIEATSATFGDLMGELFVYKDDMWKERLYNIGYYLGKYIYILDAYTDIKDDIKSGNYNPLKGIYEKEDFKDRVGEMLTLQMSECVRYFEELPIVKDAGILRNILYDGVWNRFRRENEKDGK